MAEAGSRIGRWRLVRRLGVGASTNVWLAVAVDDDRERVAIKLLRPHRLDRARARFDREALGLRALHHPGLVGYRDHGTLPDEATCWLAMDLVDGDDLADAIARGPMAPDAVRRLFRDLSGALAHAHAQGVFHGNLKPRNVRVLPDGGGVVLDFGIALEEGGAQLAAEGLLPGTIGYLPPEVFERGARPNPRLVDVHALGLLLLEALTGVAAFPVDEELSTPQQSVRIVAEKLERRKVAVPADVPLDLAGLIEIATHPDPARRLPTMAAFHERLDGPGSGLGASRTPWLEVDDEPAPDPAAFLDLDDVEDHLLELQPEPVDDEPVEPVEGREAAGEPPAVEPAPPRRATGERPFLVLLGLGAVTAAVGSLVLGAIAWGLATRQVLPEAQAVASVPVHATLTVRPSSPVARVVVDGFGAIGAGGTFVATVEPGRREVLLAVGDGCGGETPSCGACCACVVHPVDVGAPVTDVTLDAPEPPPAGRRALQVRLEGDTGGAPVSVRIAGAPAAREGDAYTATATTGTTVRARVDVGACRDDDGGCTKLGICTPGCGSAEVDVAVPCGAEPLVVVVPVPAVAAPPDPALASATTKAAPKPGVRAKAVAPTRRAVAGADAVPEARLVVTALGERASGTVDPGALAAAVRGLATRAEACWRRLDPPYRSLPPLVLDFKVAKGTVDAGSVTQAQGTDREVVDRCIRHAVAQLVIADAKPGKGRATFRFSAR